jgi:hypothetical protein
MSTLFAEAGIAPANLPSTVTVVGATTTLCLNVVMMAESLVVSNPRHGVCPPAEIVRPLLSDAPTDALPVTTALATAKTTSPAINIASPAMILMVHLAM